MDLAVKKLYANIGKLITSSLNLPEILSGIFNEIRLFFDPENWSLLRYDAEKDILYFELIYGIDFEKVKDIQLKPGEGIAGKVFSEKKSIFVPDASIEPEFSRKVDEKTGFITHSIIAVPLVFRDKIYGVIEVVNRMNGQNFTDDEHIILNTIADFAAIAFANFELHSKIKEAAYHDPLTKTLNRASFYEWKERCQIQNKGIKIIVFDLDNFKTLNDSEGHDTGDAILVSFTEFIKNQIPFGRLFRMGGDEFILAIEESKNNNIESIQNRIDNLEKAAKKTSEKIEFSFGYASGQCNHLDSIIKEADKNMYKVKFNKKASHEKNSTTH